MTVLICGGDARQSYATEELTRLGYSVRYLPLARGDAPPDDIGGGDVLLLPVPSTKDGIHLNCGIDSPPTLIDIAASGPARVFGGGFSAAFVAEMRRGGRETVDLLSLPSFTEQNAALTAEAALGVGMQAVRRSLRGLDVAVIGYGRIASRLTRGLLLLGARVRVYARRDEARLAALLDGAASYDISALRRTLSPARLVFNTVPAPLLTYDITSRLSDCVIVELASGRENITPPGRDDVVVHFAHSLPGKVFPVSAGQMIARTLDRVLREEGAPT